VTTRVRRQRGARTQRGGDHDSSAAPRFGVRHNFALAACSPWGRHSSAAPCCATSCGGCEGREGGVAARGAAGKVAGRRGGDGWIAGRGERRTRGAARGWEALSSPRGPVRAAAPWWRAASGGGRVRVARVRGRCARALRGCWSRGEGSLARGVGRGGCRARAATRREAARRGSRVRRRAGGWTRGGVARGCAACGRACAGACGDAGQLVLDCGLGGGCGRRWRWRARPREKAEEGTVGRGDVCGRLADYCAVTARRGRTRQGG